MIQKIKCAIGIHFPWSPPWMYPRDVICRWCWELLTTAEETSLIIEQEDKERERVVAELTKALDNQKVLERYGIRA